MISRGAMHTVIVPEPAKSAVCTNIHCSTLFENVIQYTDKKSQPTDGWHANTIFSQ